MAENAKPDGGVSYRGYNYFEEIDKQKSRLVKMQFHQKKKGHESE